MIEYRGISFPELMNKFLFIVNYDENDFKSKNPSLEYDQIKLGIYNMISSLGNKNISNLNICFFNAKYYETYIFKLKYYGSTDYFVNYEYKQYLKDQSKFLSKFRYQSFDKYLLQKLKTTVKNDISEKFVEKEIYLDEDIIDSMKKTLKTQILLFSQEQFNLMIKYLAFGKENICKSHFLHKSNIDEFLKNLFTLVLRTKRIEDEDIFLNLKNCIEIFDESVFKEEKKNKENKENDNIEEENEDYEEYETDNKMENKCQRLWDDINETLINEI